MEMLIVSLIELITQRPKKALEIGLWILCVFMALFVMIVFATF